MRLTEELLSELPEAYNWMFLLFLGCFYLSIQLWSWQKPLFRKMCIDLLYLKKRIDPYYIASRNESICKILLSLQTIICLSIILYSLLNPCFHSEFTTLSKLFFDLGRLSLFVTAYFLFRFLFPLLFGRFFNLRTERKIWQRDFSSVFSLYGLGLLIPTIWIFYEENTYPLCFYTKIGGACLIELWIICKTYTLFFNHKNRFFYFILYLCGLELVPLYCILQMEFASVTIKNTLLLWL